LKNEQIKENYKKKRNTNPIPFEDEKIGLKQKENQRIRKREEKRNKRRKGKGNK